MAKYRPEFKGSTSMVEQALATENESERSFALACANSGSRFLRGGWPDFLVLNQDGSPACVVEVKNKIEELRPNQIEMLTVLAKVLPVYVAIMKPDGKQNLHQFPLVIKE